MIEMQTIDLTTAKGMTKGRLTVEIGKHAKYLREKYGMDRKEATTFMSNVLNLGVAIEKYFDQEKSK